jgi:ABC-type transporter Mla subunit MlaD
MLKGGDFRSAVKQEEKIVKPNLELISEGSKNLEELKLHRQKLSSQIYEGLEKTEKLYGNLNFKNAKQVNAEMSKLDKSLEDYGQYNQTIADLVQSLTSTLGDYVNFASQSKNYEGLEKLIRLWPFGGKQTADRLRINRLKSQKPAENLKIILDYAEDLYREICEVREGGLTTYGRLQANADVITQKIAEFEPREASLKEKLDAMEAAYKEKDAAYQTAVAQEQAKLVGEMNKMHKELTELRNEYDQVFTIYNQAQQALEANKQSRDAFEKMSRDLGRQATMIKEKVDNVTEVYLAAPEAVKVMMATKGMESMDKAINLATDKSVDIITESAEAVSDATLAREAIQIIDEKVMRGYMKRMEETMRNFTERYDKIRGQAIRSSQERYGA